MSAYLLLAFASDMWLSCMEFSKGLHLIETIKRMTDHH